MMAKMCLVLCNLLVLLKGLGIKKQHQNINLVTSIGRKCLIIDENKPEHSKTTV